MRLRHRLTALAFIASTLLGACKSDRPVEFVNITFTPSVDTAHYETWDFDLERCVDLGDPRGDDVFVRKHLLAEMERELTALGVERRQDGTADCSIHYELYLTASDAPGTSEERVRGKIFVRDALTGRYVWRGERKAPATGLGSDEERVESIRFFVQDLLQYTRDK